MSGAKLNEALVADTVPSLKKTPCDTPVPGQNQVVVEVSHVAQNPTDGKHICSIQNVNEGLIEIPEVQSFDSKAFGDGAVYGCDFVGKVVELGAKVTRLAAGDVVAGLVWGGW